MAKRSLLILILLAILGGTFWVFQQFKLTNENVVDSISTIPDNVSTLLCLNSQDWNSFYSQSDALSGLLGEEYNSLFQFIEQYDSLRSQKEGIQELLNIENKYLSFFKSHKPGNDWMFSMGLYEFQNTEYIKDLFPKANFETKKIGETNIYNGNHLSWTINNQILWVSTNPNILIESLDKQGAQQVLIKDAMFMKAFEAKGENNIQILSNNALEKFHLTDNQSTNWKSYEIRLSDNQLDVFGYSFNNNHVSKVTNKVSKFEIPWGIIPYEKLKLELIVVEEINQYLADIKSELDVENKLSPYINSISSIESECQCEVEKIAFNRTSSYGYFENKNRPFVFINYENFDEAFVEYTPLLKTESSQEVLGYSIMEIKYPNLYATLLNQSSLEVARYFTIKNNYMVFASKIENLHWIINQWNNNEVMSQQSISSTTSEIQDHWFMFQNEGEKQEIAYPFFAKSKEILWQKNKEENGIYNRISFHSNYKKPITNTIQNIVIKEDNDENSAIRDSQTTESFSLDIGVEIISAPSIIINHYTQEKEVLVQDINNNLHLINNKAKSLWKREIEGEIKSEITQIDIYRNGKLQLIFNTDNKIYCIDRNGKNVDGFPINLKSKATSKLAIFDYDNKRKYRIVIACSDKNIYNYTIEGKNTFGWKYKPVDSPVKTIQHVRIKGKDYIFTLLENNKIKILKRTGAIKYKTNATAINYNGNGYALDIASTINKSRMLYVDTDGNLVDMPFNEKTPNIKKSGFENSASFTFKDIDGDKKSNYIIATGKELNVYDSNLELLFSKIVDSKIKSQPEVYKFNSKDYGIGVFTNKFVIVDSEGNVITKYSSIATRMGKLVDLDLDGVMELVVVEGSRIEFNFN